VRADKYESKRRQNVRERGEHGRQSRGEQRKEEECDKRREKAARGQETEKRRAWANE
jgi:hypothetical protein